MHETSIRNANLCLDDLARILRFQLISIKFHKGLLDKISNQDRYNGGIAEKRLNG